MTFVRRIGFGMRVFCTRLVVMPFSGDLRQGHDAESVPIDEIRTAQAGTSQSSESKEQDDSKGRADPLPATNAQDIPECQQQEQGGCSQRPELVVLHCKMGGIIMSD